MADGLVVDVYRLTRGLPVEERYGIQSQIRRACLSVPTNIVEGCARRSTREYLQFVTVALGSASEVRYLLAVSERLGMLSRTDTDGLVKRYDELVRGLQKLVDALQRDR